MKISFIERTLVYIDAWVSVCWSTRTAADQEKDRRGIAVITRVREVILSRRMISLKLKRLENFALTTPL